LAINGDYFGNAVNLAARLVSAAAPGQILTDAALQERLPHWPATPYGPLTLKGFEDPVPAFELRAAGGEHQLGATLPRCGERPASSPD
jgi:class 3 adenylate cyclase